ncbi:MAG: hypothetical protein HOK21_22860 [Rhodospirillaceae bacterium]|nr:hypothetical protein [Rhodospirillaceae bacterium]MBT5081495.1 hypothetical protein [Rhodospirillaceae bacterium]MBT5526937.1 hypothetical protein [Rhodospirillaceae bacterium]MBT5881833.1 hypothetical protein [Rhodospirillaceae bacterium]MBT6587538.1 hypothetical protein [Rhodospirillaceae bacterium]
MIPALNAQPSKSPDLQSKKFGIPLLSWGAVYGLFWCYRSFFSVVGEVVIMRLTPISDTRTYQSSDLISSFVDIGSTGYGGTLGFQALATGLTQLIGGVFGAIFFHNAILSNIGFQTIGFIGLVAMLRALEPKERALFLPLLMLPSVTVWTSIASKEALLTFMLGIICAHIINIYKNKDKIRWYHWFSLLLLYAFKPHFLISVMYVLLITYTAKYFRQKATVAIVALISSLMMLYFFRDEYSELANWTNTVLAAMGGESGRPALLVEEYDVFYKAPYGMFISFFGPTLGEVDKVLQVFTFIESSAIIAVFLGLIIRGLWFLPIYSVIVSFGVIFWIIFLNYPLGATNAGTAIRYRSGYILLIFLAFIFLGSRSHYVDWTQGLKQRLSPLRQALFRMGLLKIP